MAHTTSTRMKRRPTCTVQGSPSTCRSAWCISLACRTMSWQVQPLTKRGWWRPLLRLMRKRGRGWCLDSWAVVVLAVLLRSTTWCMPHLGVSCINHNSSRIGSITHNFNRDNSSCNNSRSSNSSSSIVPLPYHHSRLPSCHRSSFPPATFHASTVERWVTSLGNAACPSRAALCELRCPW
jgi:hypothetical protein